MTKTKILIIDDEPGIIEFMQMALEAKGYNVASALSGEAGLAAVDDNPPHIVLLDIMMPGLNGFEVCKQLKSNNKTKNIPVLMISAKAQTADVEMGISVGAEDYIIKPFEMKDVLKKIDSCLKNP
ncbi:MAG: response regulator [Deltaproteobacteria bacterium]|nr:response regulator [Deltaproteobacteria bacterium]